MSQGRSSSPDVVLCTDSEDEESQPSSSTQHKATAHTHPQPQSLEKKPEILTKSPKKSANRESAGAAGASKPVAKPKVATTLLPAMPPTNAKKLEAKAGEPAPDYVAWRWPDFRDFPTEATHPFSFEYQYDARTGENDKEKLTDTFQVEVSFGREDLSEMTVARGYHWVQAKFVASQRLKIRDMERSLVQSLLPLNPNPEHIRRAVQELVHNLFFLSQRAGAKPAEEGPEPVVRTSMPFLNSEGIRLIKTRSERFKTARFLCHWCDYHVRGICEARKHIATEEHSRLHKEHVISEMIRELPPPPDAQLELLGMQLLSVAKEAGRGVDELARIRAAVARLQTDIRRRVHPKLSLRLYGSCQSGFGLQKGNVNVELLYPEEEMKHNAALILVGSALKAVPKTVAGLREDFGHRCPKLVFKFADFKEAGEVHLSVGNGLAFDAGQLLGVYGAAWPGLRVLAQCFRAWGRICQMDDAMGGGLPPYAFDILLVHFLQRLRPTLIPVLHELGISAGENGADFHKYQNDMDVIHSVMGAAAKEPTTPAHLGWLWVQLFRYLALGEENGTIRDRDVPLYQIRSSQQLRRESKCSPSWQRAHLPIEDPFMVNKNLGAGMKSDMWAYWSACLRFSLAHWSIPRAKTGGGQLLWIFTTNGSLRWNPAVEKPAPEQAAQIELPAKLRPEPIHVETDEEREADASMILEEMLTDLEEDEDETEDSGDVGDDKRYSTSAMSAILASMDEKGPSAELQASIDAAGLALKPNRRHAVSNFVAKVLRPKTGGKSPPKAKPAAPVTPAKLGSRAELAELWRLAAVFPATELITSFSAQAFTNGTPPVLLCGNCSLGGHTARDCPENGGLRAPPLPPLDSQFLELVEILAKHIYDTRQMTAERAAFQESFRTQLTEILKKRLSRPDARLDLFGSSHNGFGLELSDLDLCLRFADPHLPPDMVPSDMIRQVGAILHKDGRFGSVFPVTQAKVPIVKFTVHDRHLDGDISLYNTLALRNTLLIRSYCELDERVRILGYLIKVVAKSCEIGDASRGSLSSYAYVLMLIHFLQSTTPPVLPILQEIEPPKDRSPFKVEGWDTYFYEDLKSLKWKSKNTLCVSQLFLGFLDFYTTGQCFDYERDVVQIRRREGLSKFEKLWCDRRMAIEDPFELCHNLASGLSNKMFSFIMRSLMKIRDVFGKADSFSVYGRLCNRYSVSGKDAVALEQYFLGPALRLEEKLPDDRLCRFCKHVGHFVENCPEKAKSARNRRNARPPPGRPVK